MDRIEVFIILLQSDAERVKHVNSLIEAYSSIDLKFTIFGAVDGKSLNDQRMKDYVDQGFVYSNYRLNRTLGIQYYRGQIGCALSHYLLWKYGRKKNYQRLIVIEDDVLLCDRFPERIREVLDQLPDDYDHCFLFNHRNLSAVNQGGDHLVKCDQKVNINQNQESWGTVGYILSQKGIRELSKRIQPMRNTLDAMLREVIQKKEIKSYMCDRNLVTTVGSLNSHDAKSELGSNVWNSGRF